MTNDRLQSDFYLAVRHVKEAERICARQQRLVDDLKRASPAREEAEALLKTYGVVLEQFRQHVQDLAASTRALTERT
jgi:F0F1-type ATP synthase membrane subunit b/b'